MELLVLLVTAVDRNYNFVICFALFLEPAMGFPSILTGSPQLITTVGTETSVIKQGDH